MIIEVISGELVLAADGQQEFMMLCRLNENLRKYGKIDHLQRCLSFKIVNTLEHKKGDTDCACAKCEDELEEVGNNQSAAATDESGKDSTVKVEFRL